MAFVWTPGVKIPANRAKPAKIVASVNGPDTAQYGRVWPNEWPNGEICSRDQVMTSRPRDGRDRGRLHRRGASLNRHYRMSTAAATSDVLSPEVDASLRWLPAADDRKISADGR